MVTKNEHAQRSNCPVACGLDIIGDHWTLLIIRDLLMMGRHEFRDMLDAEEGISSNILTDRLNKLQAADLVRSIPHPDSKRRKLYYLTAQGKDLIYVIAELAKWSATHRPEQVIIPKERLALMRKGPQHFVKSTLQALAEWEKSVGLEGRHI
jgi:DNA-binding HxlR family transcriptional regulator